MGFPSNGCSYKPQIRGQDNWRRASSRREALVLIFGAESNEELDSILQRLPLWDLQVESNSARDLEGRTS
jgi:muconolactone delta-isomerase